MLDFLLNCLKILDILNRFLGFLLATINHIIPIITHGKKDGKWREKENSGKT